MNSPSCSSHLNLCNKLDHHHLTIFPNNIAINPIITRKAAAIRMTTTAVKAAASCYMPSSSSQSEEEGTLYEILGINSENGKTATLSDIKKAYKQMARIYHPDVSPPGSEDKYTQKFIKLKEAYETLSDSQSKAFYDLNLASPSSSQEGWKEEGRIRWQSQLEQLNQRRSGRRRRTTAA